MIISKILLKYCGDSSKTFHTFYPLQSHYVFLFSFPEKDNMLFASFNTVLEVCEKKKYKVITATGLVGSSPARSGPLFMGQDINSLTLKIEAF